VDNINPVETRMRADNILITKLVGTIDVPMIKAMRESVSMYFGRIAPTDWIIDANAVDKISHDTTQAIGELFADMRKQNGRHFILIAKHPAVRMHAGTASWTSGAKLSIVEGLDEALTEMAKRLKED
jgi:anti-anti-sigma regulatory factor